LSLGQTPPRCSKRWWLIGQPYFRVEPGLQTSNMLYHLIQEVPLKSCSSPRITLIFKHCGYTHQAMQQLTNDTMKEGNQNAMEKMTDTNSPTHAHISLGAAHRSCLGNRIDNQKRTRIPSLDLLERLGTSHESPSPPIRKQVTTYDNVLNSSSRLAPSLYLVTGELMQSVFEAKLETSGPSKRALNPGALEALENSVIAIGYG
jgi:hypothetical protein